MKKFYIVYLIILVIGCKQEDIDSDKFVMRAANPKATIDDGSVQLHLDNYAATEYVLLPYERVKPDKFDIYISKNDLSNFHKLIELEYDEICSYTIDELQNGSPCFFYVVSKKKGYKSITSDTIMVVPNKRKEFEILQATQQSGGDAHTLFNVSVAHQKNKIAYSDAYYSWEGGSDCCMGISVIISNMDGSEKELVDIDSYHPCWSPGNDKIVFHTEKGEINQGDGMPSQIALYDCETKSITKLTEGNDYNYAPVFAANGEFLLYQSSKKANTPDIYATNIWMMNLKTLEDFQITDVAKTSLLTVERPCWIDNDRFLFHGINSEGKSQLYESSVSNKQINKVFDSLWSDYTPSISPDQKKIAFISNRSGYNQVWIYDMDAKRYYQITGYTLQESIDRYWCNIEWLDNVTIVFTYNSSQYLLLKQKVT